MIGRRLAHYEILAELGKGGMGVVYKACDTHLDRDVAIKILPTDALTDLERKQRFTQEAKAASALNHPGIVTIYDIAHADRPDSRAPYQLELRFVDVATAKETTLQRFEGRDGSGLTASRDRKTIFYSGTTVSQGSDLMLIRNFR